MSRPRPDYREQDRRHSPKPSTQTPVRKNHRKAGPAKARRDRYAARNLNTGRADSGAGLRGRVPTMSMPRSLPRRSNTCSNSRPGPLARTMIGSAADGARRCSARAGSPLRVRLSSRDSAQPSGARETLRPPSMSTTMLPRASDGAAQECPSADVRADQPQFGNTRREQADDRKTVVARAVVDGHDLERPAETAKMCRHRPHLMPHRLLVVPDSQNDGNIQDQASSDDAFGDSWGMTGPILEHRACRNDYSCEVNHLSGSM